MMKYGEKIIDKIIEDNGPCKIAFLPYKFSMWDSLETVYDAAVERGLTTYLMPIPYMTRGDGLWHDETHFFGKNVDNRALLKEFAPDVVFIHYPYDDNNRVTCIDPLYSSESLKSAGYKIAYLAYCGSVWAEHIILQKGVKNADYIFVASEEEKGRYIELWRQKEVDISKNVFCLGGLPKYEAFFKQRFNSLEFKMSEGYIVLICGTLQTFLNEREKRIEKWLNAVKRFAQQKNTFVIFRPHPLMEDTIKAMLPQYQLRYEKFLKDIDELCYVDKSQRFQASIISADYLVSDPSSVTEVWKYTGKAYEIIE